jgi:hypothetical protein
VPVLVDRDRHRQAALAERLHEGELFDGREAREVEPREVVALAQVVALRFDRAEGGAAEAMQLERHDDAVLAGDLQCTAAGWGAGAGAGAGGRGR